MRERQLACSIAPDVWEALKENPKPVKGLRKIKARYMLEAMTHLIMEAGNHRIVFTGESFLFYYRGTLLCIWHVLENQCKFPDAGAYEESMSTLNQRKEIYNAIQNFVEVYLCPPLS